MSRPEPVGGPPRLLLGLLTGLLVIGALLRRRPESAFRRAPSGVDPEALAAGYEHRDVRAAVVLGGAAALLVMLGLVVVAITVFEAGVTGLAPSVAPPAELIQGLQATSAPTPVAPRLEAQPEQEFAPYRAAQQQKLSTYRWVDRQAGVVAVPIERAMDLIVEQGLPAQATQPVHDRGDRSPSRASSGRVDEAYP